jgi:hypothetical protein
MYVWFWPTLVFLFCSTSHYLLPPRDAHALLITLLFTDLWYAQLHDSGAFTANKGGVEVSELSEVEVPENQVRVLAVVAKFMVNNNERTGSSVASSVRWSK